MPNLGPQIPLEKCEHNSNKCAINMRVRGNVEEGMREYGDRWEFNCMDLQPETNKA